jgi:hypothetical protein
MRADLRAPDCGVQSAARGLLMSGGSVALVPHAVTRRHRGNVRSPARPVNTVRRLPTRRRTAHLWAHCGMDYARAIIVPRPCRHASCSRANPVPRHRWHEIFLGKICATRKAPRSPSRRRGSAIGTFIGALTFCTGHWVIAPGIYSRIYPGARVPRASLPASGLPLPT